MDKGGASVEGERASVEDTPSPRNWSEKFPESPCGPRPGRHRTSPTHSLRGERDRSETKIRTADRQLAGGSPRELGDEAAGVGVEDWIGRERHQYRSSRRALVTHTHEGPSPIFGTDCAIAVRGQATVHRNARNLCMNWSNLWRSWANPVEGEQYPQKIPRNPCVRAGARHRTSPTLSSGRAGSARRRGSARRTTSLPEDRAGPGDEAVGTGVKAGSIGSVTSTDHPKGPCDSYSRGPFTYFTDVATTPCDSTHARFRGRNAHSVDQDRSSTMPGTVRRPGRVRTHVARA